MGKWVEEKGYYITVDDRTKCKDIPMELWVFEYAHICGLVMENAFYCEVSWVVFCA